MWPLVLFESTAATVGRGRIVGVEPPVDVPMRRRAVEAREEEETDGCERHPVALQAVDIHLRGAGGE